MNYFVSHELNFLEVKELRSYRSRWSLGVKPLVLSIGYKRNNIWLNSLTPLTPLTPLTC